MLRGGQFGAAPALLGLLLAISVATVPAFRTLTNATTVLAQASLGMLIAVGASYVLVAGHIDLSVGSVVALASVAFGVTIQAGLHPAFAVIAALLIASVIGSLSGLLAIGLRVPAFVATLATMGIARGVALLLSGGRSIPIGPHIPISSAWVGDDSIPLAIFVAIGIAFAADFVLMRTRVGVHIRATGSSRQSAARNGIAVSSLSVISFVIGAIFSACTGLFITLRLLSAQPIYGAMYELEAITAAVIGGVSLTGGRGRPIGAAAGALSVAIVRNVLTLLNIEYQIQLIAIGFLLIVGHLFIQRQSEAL